MIDKAALEREATQLRAEVHELTREGKQREAIPKAERLITIAQQLFHPLHPTVATLLENLADLYEAVGRDQDARDARDRAADINASNEQPGTDPEVDRLVVQAKAYFDRGDYERAFRSGRAALAAVVRKGLEGTHQHAVVIGELGRIAEAVQLLEEAEHFYQLSAVIADSLGHHRQLAVTLNNLGLLYWKMRRLDDAEKALSRSLAIDEGIRGPQDPQLAFALVNLGLVYASQGKPDVAREKYLGARALIVNAYGRDHPVLSDIYNNLAALAWRQRDLKAAVLWQEQANRVIAKNMMATIVLGSERQKHLYMAKFLDAGNASVSLSLGLGKDWAPAGRLAFNSVLQRKGRVMDAVSRSLERVRLGLSESDRQILEEFVTLQKARAELIYSRGSNLSATGLAFDPARIEQLQAYLGGRAQLKDLFQEVTVETVESALPAGSALIEFVQYTPLRPPDHKGQSHNDPLRYAAYVLLASGEMYWLDVGERSVVDRRVSDIQRGLADPRSTYVKRIAHELYQQVFLPVQTFLGDTDTIFIAPDGALNLIPFSALVDDSGKYLVEQYTFSYLSSGRDLLREPNDTSASEAVIIVANPDYGALEDGTVAPCTGADRRSTRSFGKGFQRLCGTELEASAIANILPEAEVISDTAATETAIKQLHRPAILHLATHGFYQADLLSTKPAMTPAPPSQVGAEPLSDLDRALASSGLVFAGVNERRSGDDDGILTALEATALDLSGTQLVVLSACETGIGKVMAGEGVFGLRRALVLAGAESQIMTLWTVSDTATASLMARYYEFLIARGGRSGALRDAQLELMADSLVNRVHPHYWASFILSGNWRPVTAGIPGID